MPGDEPLSGALVSEMERQHHWAVHVAALVSFWGAAVVKDWKADAPENWETLKTG